MLCAKQGTSFYQNIRTFLQGVNVQNHSHEPHQRSAGIRAGHLGAVIQDLTLVLGLPDWYDRGHKIIPQIATHCAHKGSPVNVSHLFY